MKGASGCEAAAGAAGVRGGVTPPVPESPVPVRSLWSGRSAPRAGRRSPGGGMRTPVTASLLRDVCGSKGCKKGGETQPVWIILKIQVLCFRGMLHVVSPQRSIRNGITAPSSSLNPFRRSPRLWEADTDPDPVGVHVLCHKRVKLSFSLSRSA